MGQVEIAAGGETSSAAEKQKADTAWAESLRDVMREVIASLPDHATLGELIEAARKSPAMASVLEIFTVQELIETAKKRPKAVPIVAPPPVVDASDDDDSALMDLDSPAVIRRRADVPDGDLRVLRCLVQRGPQRESDMAMLTHLTSEQLRIILRNLRTKGFLHVEGSGLKRRYKVTRTGSGYLRKQLGGGPEPLSRS